MFISVIIVNHIFEYWKALKYIQTKFYRDTLRQNIKQHIIK